MSMKETVTRYHWPAESLIQRVELRTLDDGRSVAYLYANNDPALKQQRLNVRGAIRLKGWGTLSDHRDNEFGLRVAGLHGGDELIRMLSQEGFILGTPTINTTTIADPKPQGFLAGIRNNTLKWSGILATIANSMSFASGIHRGKDWGQMGQGLLFGVADLPLAIAGERDDARQLGDFLRQLKKHYDKEGIEIPRTASIYVETSDKGKGFGERTLDFLHRYANQIKCSFEVAAAASTIHAGKNQNSSFKKYAPYVWGPGFFASLLIPEKKIDEEKYAQAGPLGRFWMKIQSNPLSVGGVLGYTNVFATYGSAIKERKESLAPGGNGRHFYRWDFAIPTIMIGGNGLYAMSKKTVGGDIKSNAMVSDAYTIAAQIINKQPENLREKAIESTAQFFGERTEIPEHRSEAIARLHKEVEIQRQNPWFEPLGLAAYVPMPKTHKVLKLEEGALAHASTATNATIDKPLEADSTQLPRLTITQAQRHGVNGLATYANANEIG
ncbi:MAG: hypothetical protein K2X09_07960, partial [Rickettsiales bacterium]|nr:hypothetical protein [Rickettsiales bacterium]